MCSSRIFPHLPVGYSRRAPLGCFSRAGLDVNFVVLKAKNEGNCLKETALFSPIQILPTRTRKIELLCF